MGCRALLAEAAGALLAASRSGSVRARLDPPISLEPSPSAGDVLRLASDLDGRNSTPAGLFADLAALVVDRRAVLRRLHSPARAHISTSPRFFSAAAEPFRVRAAEAATTLVSPSGAWRSSPTRRGGRVGSGIIQARRPRNRPRSHAPHRRRRRRMQRFQPPSPRRGRRRRPRGCGV